MKETKELEAVLSLLQESQQTQTALLNRIESLEQKLTEETGERRRPKSSIPPGDGVMTLDQLLRESEPMEEDQIIRVLKAPYPDEVRGKLRELESQDKLVNLGTEKLPRWTWKIGDETSTDELTHHVVRLLTDRPMTWRELLYATGARHGRLTGAIERARKEFGAINIRPDTPRKAVWFISKK